MRDINVLIVDDSGFMRRSIAMMLESDPTIHVCGNACDGKEAIEKIKELHPDIVTMDIEMPGMDGLTALGIIMKEFPLPVLMISSLTNEGAEATLDALALGAIDFIPKDFSFVSLDIIKIKENLIAKVKLIVQNNGLQFRLQRIRSISKGLKSSQTSESELSKPSTIISTKSGRPYEGVVLAISTGGPSALMDMIPRLPKNFPLGIAIVQHMPPRFTKTLADRLDGMSELSVKEAEDGEPMEHGTVYIAPGGRHMIFSRRTGKMYLKIVDEPRDVLYHPSADIMMTSASEQFLHPLIGVVMTGMGKDGLEGLKLIKKKGGYILAQDEESCIIYGMPKAVVDEHVSDRVLSLQHIPTVLSNLAVNSI